jgi:hypothetical protein
MTVNDYGKKRHLFLSCFLCFICFGFSEQTEDFQISLENGVPVALNPDHPVPTENSAWDIVFEEELILGSTGGDPQTQFGELISYTADDEGNIYVLDWRAKTVKKFNLQGNHILTFGREGQGPGEFSYPVEIRLLPGGHLIVFEGEAQKFSVFDQKGNFIKSGRFSKLMSPPFFGFSNGNFIATHVRYEQDRTLIITGLFNDESELLITLKQTQSQPLQPWPRDDPDARVKRFAEIMSRTAFDATEAIALDRKEVVYYSFTDKFEIKVLSPTGTLERIIRTALPFRPVTKNDRKNFLDIWVPKDISSWSTMDEATKKKIIGLIRFPEKKPALLEIIPMDNDFLLVLRGGLYGENALIDVFDTEGRFIIEKELSFPVKNGLSRGEKLYTLYEDEEGFQFVKRYSFRFVGSD